MTWKIKFRPSAKKDFSKLENSVQKRVIKLLFSLPAGPRSKGSPLKSGEKGESLWRYRVGDYRVVCNLQDDEKIIRVLRIGHRKHIYRQM